MKIYFLQPIFIIMPYLIIACFKLILISFMPCFLFFKLYNTVFKDALHSPDNYN